jgi:hypothetical protein
MSWRNDRLRGLKIRAQWIDVLLQRRVPQGSGA